MKYEYLKGSERAFDGGDGRVVVIFSVDNKDGLFRSVNPSNDDFPKGWNIIAERRPITEPVWDGEGLPPVGVECEIKRVADWFPVTIKFISGYYTVILTRGGTEDVYQTSALQFRPIPIRSPEDVARSNAIGEMERAYEDLTGNPAREAEEYYDLIAAGKIKGVKLEGK